jgi:light-harvesting complex I chlorophyll a/b binding protein 4
MRATLTSVLFTSLASSYALVASSHALVVHTSTVGRHNVIAMSTDDERLAAEATASALAAAEAAEAAAREQQASAPAFDIRSLAGVSAPLGFWDPAGFSEGKREGTLRFWREVEIKHSRVAMLAAVGFPIAEQFHPLFGGTIDVPSYIAFQQTPLQTFWPLVIAVISIFETYSVFTFDRPYDLFYSDGGGFWSIRAEHAPGDMGFDPLGFMPTDAAERVQMETKELNHGRAATIGIAGMVAQELATGQKLF